MKRSASCFSAAVILFLAAGTAAAAEWIVAGRVGRPLDRLRQWALQVQARTCHNKAAVALANKLARIVWATWCHGEDFRRREALGLSA
jgi:hypothetical protein